MPRECDERRWNGDKMRIFVTNGDMNICSPQGNTEFHRAFISGHIYSLFFNAKEKNSVKLCVTLW